MGFKSVYRTLQELFPQVDTRLLKAAAIEHVEDPDEAVDFILTEVIPHTVEKFDPASPGKRTLVSSVECKEKQLSSPCASSSKHESNADYKAANGSEVMKPPYHMDPPCLNVRVQDSLTFYDAKDFNDQFNEYAMSKESTASKTQETYHQDISVLPKTGDTDNRDTSEKPDNNSFGGTSELQKYRDLDLQTLALSTSSTPALDLQTLAVSTSSNPTLDLQTLALSTSSTPALVKDPVPDVSLNKRSDDSASDCESLSVNSNVAVQSENQKYQPDFDSDSLYGSNYVELASLSVKDHMLESLNCSIQSNVESLMSDANLGILEVSCNDETAFREDIQALDNAHSEESSGPHSTVSQSMQVCNTDLLESIVEESKSHKKKLLSDMESVLKLMKEVEFQENAAEQAKNEAAAKGGLEIFAKVDELKSMLKRAREANDMHSGEVYGERAILATEMKELQSRLLALSDLKEESLSILDVMRQTLEARLAAAEMERITAEQEKYESEESARKALAEQEQIMEKVVEESKILQQEAEENARLREFLMDRGHVVDMLQGEISVICQDVKLLKEKLDNRVPLSQSISSEQTSCILASSGSARKSTDSEQLLKHEKPSALSAEPFLLPSVEKTAEDTQNELLDEGWELFEVATDD